MPSGIEEERGVAKRYLKRCAGVGALCVKGSCWCSLFKLPLERAGV